MWRQTQYFIITYCNVFYDCKGNERQNKNLKCD